MAHIITPAGPAPYHGPGPDDETIERPCGADRDHPPHNIGPGCSSLLRTWLVCPGAGPQRHCRICGCTDDTACDGGCWWVRDPEGGHLCSACKATL